LRHAIHSTTEQKYKKSDTFTNVKRRDFRRQLHTDISQYFMNSPNVNDTI